MTESDVDAVDLHMRAPALSLHAPAGDDVDGRSLSEVVPESIPHNPEDDASRRQLKGLYDNKLAEFARDHLLDDRERVIWEKRLLAVDQASLAELGVEFGVSKERVRQVEERMKHRLKAFLEAHFGDSIEFEFSHLWT